MPKVAMYWSYLLVTLLVAFPRPLLAHPLSPSIWKLVEKSPGLVSMEWKTPVAKIPGVDIFPRIPLGCKTTRSAEPVREGAFWLTHLELRCENSWINKPFRVAGIESSRSNVIVYIHLADARHFQHILNADSASYSVPERMSQTDVFANYFPLGLDHILSGWDHLLFVLVLFLLISSRRKLVWCITAFTIGHSITLSTAVLEVFPIPSSLVEVLIAVSILVLALELLRDQTTFFHRYSWLIALSFGLLHGFGFAGALAELGLPTGDIPLALFSFNLGIEAGQLLFISVLLIFSVILNRLDFLSQLKRIEIPAYVIGSLAAFWMIERLGELTY